MPPTATPDELRALAQADVEAMNAYLDARKAFTHACDLADAGNLAEPEVEAHRKARRVAYDALAHARFNLSARVSGKAIQALDESPRWIPVEDFTAHPAEYGLVTVDVYGEVYVDDGWSGNDGVWYTQGSPFGQKVTHYMPRPKPAGAK